MNVILLILYICLTFIYCYDNLYLSVYSITSGNSQLPLSYRDRKKRPISDYIYTGPFENIEKVLYNSRNNIEKIKNETHPWVYICKTIKLYLILIHRIDIFLIKLFLLSPICAITNHFIL